jgi:hypothetical protein
LGNLLILEPMRAGWFGVKGGIPAVEVLLLGYVASPGTLGRIGDGRQGLILLACLRLQST